MRSASFEVRFPLAMTVFVVLVASLPRTGCEFSTADDTAVGNGAPIANDWQSTSSLSGRYSSLVNYSDVLLIRNVNSVESMTIADYFRSERNMSWSLVCNVTTSTAEEINAATFDALATQVRSCLTSLPPGSTINFLLTTKGVPLKTWRSPWENAASVDSELALLNGPYEGQIGGFRWMTNPYFNKSTPFTTARYHFYIVTRLTAYTLNETLGLVDKATEATGRQGMFVLDADPSKDGGGYQVGNDWMRRAARILTARGFDVTMDEDYAFLSNMSDVAGYFSWGSNDAEWYIPLDWNPGFDADANADGVPDGWFYDDPAGTANLTMNSTVFQSDPYSMRVQRPIIDNNFTAVSQNISILPESRYFLSGSVNLTLGVAGRGLFLQMMAFDSSDSLLAVINGSASSGNAGWTGLRQVVYEPIPGATKLRISVVFAQANGTAFIDDVRIVEIRPHNHWIVGSLAETAVSTGGRSFTYGTQYGQSLVADLIRDGVTGVKGYVYEPYLNAVAHADILFDAYTRGYTLGESYMMASEWGLSWMDTIVGDPKLATYNKSYVPDFAVASTDILLSNQFPPQGQEIELNVTVHNFGHFPARNATVSFYDGDPRQGGFVLGNTTVTIVDGSTARTSMRFNTSGLNGWHDLCVFADMPNDYYEVSENNNIACGRIGIVVTHTMHIQSGHRFMSFPLTPVNESIGSVLSSIAGCFDYVRWYDVTDASSHWKSYAPGRGKDSLLWLDNTMGFWINMTSACDLTLLGVNSTSASIRLHAGWNMVGFPSFNSSYTVADLKASLGMTAVKVEVLDEGASPYYLRRAGDWYAMRAGEGYWVYVPSDVTWSLQI